MRVSIRATQQLFSNKRAIFSRISATLCQSTTSKGTSCRHMHMHTNRINNKNNTHHLYNHHQMLPYSSSRHRQFHSDIKWDSTSVLDRAARHERKPTCFLLFRSPRPEDTKQPTARDKSILEFAQQVAAHLQTEYGVQILTPPEAVKQIPGAEGRAMPALPPGQYGWSTSDVPEEQGTWQYDTDFCVVIGGDGTLMHLLNFFPLRCPPVAGFRGGSLGFLMPFGVAEYMETFQNIFNGQSDLLYRRRLAATILDEGQEPVETDSTPGFHLLNECVLRRSFGVQGVCEIDCSVDGTTLARFQGDGVIVSTPTGSTGYSMAAGGPIVHPTLEALGITPLASMALSTRPLLVPNTSQIILRAEFGETKVELNQARTLGLSERLWIRMSPHYLPMYTREGVSVDWINDLSARLRYERSTRRRTDDILS